MPDSYSLVNDVRDNIHLLKKHGHEPVFFAQEGCVGTGIDCEKRNVFPHFRLDKDVVNEEFKEKYKEILIKELKDFDMAITHDWLFLRSYVTQKAAVMAAQSSLPNLRWVHWSHSGVAGSLKIKMPKSKYIYMNYADIDRFAANSGIEHDDVRVIFNDKDPRLFFRWNEITSKIANRVNLFNRTIIQTYPMCSTRMDAKGLFHVVKIFGKLKQLDNKVLLIVPNANARKQVTQIERYKDMARAEGLLVNGTNEDEFIFTSTISPDYLSGVPRDVVKDLMLISNLFIFPSASEVCSNVLLEASMTKQLLVLNRDFAPILDFGEDGKTVLAYNFGSLIQSGYKYRNETRYMTLAKVVNQQLKASKSNQQFLKILNMCNIDWIFHNQWEQLLYEKY
jgi:hypothetical protein